jgi:4-hydroxybenzoate polyprenyltransferase
MTSSETASPPTGAPGGASDIRRDAWALRAAPAAVRPYLRLARIDRPIGTWLLLFPCWWGMLLATPPDSAHAGLILPALLFGIGALLMRGAGCTWNDITDRDLDGRVALTADRPIPSGEVSLAQALAYMVLLMLAALVVLLTFNRPTVWLGVASLALVFTYPFMKRVTWWPQAFLGLTFNWGALMGWTAVAGGLDPAALALYAAGIAWTLGYDTIYAHQDKEDDALVGIKSSARLLGARSRPWIAGFYAIAVLLLAVAGALTGRGWAFLVLLAVVALQLGWQARSIDLDDPADCLAKFRSNRWTGWLFAAALIVP